MEELVAHRSDDHCLGTLKVFSEAHQSGLYATGNDDNARSSAVLEERRIPLLGKMQRFRDQGVTMCDIATMLRSIDRKSEAATWFQLARDVGAAHGFFSLESLACSGLGIAAMEEGRHEEGMVLLRNALVAAELNELDDPQYELDALDELISALFTTKSIDEVEPLVLRYREAANAYSENEGAGVCFRELYSLLLSARLDEVLCICTLRLGTPNNSSAIASSTDI